MKFKTTVFQGIKFIIVGTLATLIDLAIFEFLVSLVIKNYLVAKGISFLISTTLKYAGYKYWTFQKHTHEKIHKEIFIFIILTIIGLLINLITFYYATKIIGPQFGLSTALWTELSVILAAASSAIVSFTGCKFLVFKK